MAKTKKAAAPKPARRKKKDTKEEKVEVRTVGIGDNSELAMPAPDDWGHHKKTIVGFREKVSTAQGLLRNAIKQAKKSGINMKAMDDSIAIERANDPKKAKNYFDQLGLGLELSGSTLRLTAHDTLAGDEESLVYQRGYADGEAARSPENKYPESSDLHAIYAKGWRHGTAKNIGMTPEESDAAVAEHDGEQIAAE